ncbi:LytTR family two component transcriptional regulator [Chitinophaga niastensis]|uniref:LytTR family two component transcriptional regulator n=1 Tax=Chitinophaga niastensis TaxID=536980 RepID=A0A2P8HET8_CHINA|nr:LytTR family DNA-binding domain-containing protein [Chitinophaga niastensis]PSL44742.1 LytTR family two component transcriptional regulator [Chitinophaga niastensis]
MTHPKISCIITDDEPFARKGLQGYVEKVDFLELKSVCEDGLQLGRQLQQQPVDLLFLDIQMPHISGIEFLSTLREPPKVVFTTAFEQYAIRGFELDILDYLLKPISFERFLKASNKAYEYFQSKREQAPEASYLFVKADGKLEKIIFSNILFIEGLENYVIIHLEDRKVITHATLRSFLEKLPARQFMQTHKSYIAALDKVERIEGNLLHIRKHQVPVSRNFREVVIAAIVR